MIALRIFIGLLKGVIIGGGFGAGLWALDPEGTTLSWLRWPLYGLIGLVTGVIAGRPPWAKGAWVSSIIKAIFGFGLCVGLFFLADWLVTFDVYGRDPTHWYFGFGALVGMLYGIWVEIDDGDPSNKPPKGLVSKKDEKNQLQSPDA